jgi:hypothetical protein
VGAAVLRGAHTVPRRDRNGIVVRPVRVGCVRNSSRAEADADIDARCGWSDEPIACGVTAGRAYGDGVIHLLVPAAHFWDDIGYT